MTYKMQYLVNISIDYLNEISIALFHLLFSSIPSLLHINLTFNFVTLTSLYNKKISKYYDRLIKIEEIKPHKIHTCSFLFIYNIYIYSLVQSHMT